MYASKRQKEYTVDYKRERDEFVSPLVHWRGERERGGGRVLLEVARGFFFVSYLCMRVVMNKYVLVSLSFSLSLFLGTLSLLFRFMRSKPTGRVPSRHNGI